MTKIDDGGPAFPRLQVQWITEDEHRTVASGGMSLRDWFAGQSLPTLLDVCRVDAVDEGKGFPSHVAELAYRAADAMLAARKQGGE